LGVVHVEVTVTAPDALDGIATFPENAPVASAVVDPAAVFPTAKVTAVSAAHPVPETLTVPPGAAVLALTVSAPLVGG
jgi:hypothetical protein